MSSTGHWPLQQAIFAALTADSTLMGMISGIYDFIPENIAYPFLAIGEADGQDASNLAISGMRFDLSIRAYSQQGGRKETASIMDSVFTLLNGASLTVSGQTLVFLHATSSHITLNADGVTYTGTLKLRGMLQER